MRSFITVSAMLIAGSLPAQEPPAAAPAATVRSAAAVSRNTTSGPPGTSVPSAESAVTESTTRKAESPEESFMDVKKAVDALKHLKISGYIQAQYLGDESSADELSGSSTKNKDQFSVRRARVKFVYQHHSTARFVLQPDITSSGVTLKDGYIELIEPWTSWKNTMTAGQFNWPFGFEIGYSSSSRELPERSRVVRTLFPGERDRGVMLSGAGHQKAFRYQVAIVNGTGTTQSFDANRRKDLVGRVGYSFGALDLGASIYDGAELVATKDAAKGVELDKERAGIDFQWTTPLPGLGLRGEYIRGKQASGAGSTRGESYDVDGWYVYAIQNAGERHQFALRVDQYDPNTGAPGDATRTIGGSYVFHWDDNSRVMFAYEAPKLETGDPADDVTTIRYQFSF